MKKIIIVLLSVVLVCILGIYLYRYNVSTKNNFQIKDSTNGYPADSIMFTDNSKHNKYDIKFARLNGSNTKEIISKKNNYNMKINADDISGNLNLKIYNNKKTLFNKSGSINKTISINKDNSKDVRVILTGKKAKGHVVIILN